MVDKGQIRAQQGYRWNVNDIVSVSGRGSGVWVAEGLVTKCCSYGEFKPCRESLWTPRPPNSAVTRLAGWAGMTPNKGRGSRERSRPKEWVQPWGWKFRLSGKVLENALPGEKPRATPPGLRIGPTTK
jgi:hypothetical protein